MKKTNKIFALAMTFVMGFAVATPLFAEEQKMLDKNEIQKVLELEIRNNNNDKQIILPTEEAIKKEICKNTLDYKNDDAVKYYYSTGIKEFKQATNCVGLSKFDLQEITKIRQIIASEEIPDICTQFDIMSYLISIKDDEKLLKVLDLGYNPRMYVSENSDRSLFRQTVFSNNVEAFYTLYIYGKRNNIGIGSVGIDLVNTLESFIPEIYCGPKVELQKCLDAKAQFEKEWAKKVLNSDVFVANTMSFINLMTYRTENCN